jgi:hypothetical protein
LPADFLLPLFVVTLLANAVLVAFAIRGMRRGQPDGDRPLGTGRPPTTTGVPDHGSRAPAELTAVRPTVQTGNQPEPAGPAKSAAPTESAAPPGPASESAPASSPKRRRTTKNATVAPLKRSGSPEPRRGRRRFSLPPLDDDHEKVNRSIESFLGGPDASGPGGVDPPMLDTPTEAVTGPTTVAVVAVVDLRTEPGESTAGDAPEDDVEAEALAMVERTLRGAARGTDVVTVVVRGRFRIVLPATGELAARSYLRRIRAAIEPRLEAAERTLHLAVATATVLDEPLDQAVRRAEDRLSVALDAARESDRVSRQAAFDEADGDPDVAEDAPRADAD